MTLVDVLVSIRCSKLFCPNGVLLHTILQDVHEVSIPHASTDRLGNSALVFIFFHLGLT